MTIASIHNFSIGKTQISIAFKGCVDCGATESIGCEDATRHMFRMGDKKYGIMLKRCASCAEKLGARWPAELAAKSK